MCNSVLHSFVNLLSLLSAFWLLYSLGKAIPCVFAVFLPGKCTISSILQTGIRVHFLFGLKLSCLPSNFPSLSILFFQQQTRCVNLLSSIFDMLVFTCYHCYVQLLKSYQQDLGLFCENVNDQSYFFVASETTG